MITEERKVKAEKQYIELYEQCREMIFEHSSEMMNAERDAAFNRFKTNGFPSRKVERYKYTDMQALFEPDYGLNLNRLEIPVNPYDAFRCDVPNLSTSLYFVVNDGFYTKVQAKGHLPEGVKLGSLKDLATTEYYNQLAGKDEDAVTDLNTMLAQDGLYVYVPKNVVVDRAIQVINILRSDVDLMVNRRVLIIVEEGAEVKFLFCDHAADDRRFLATQVIEAYVGENAKLDLYCLEETHNKNTRVSNVYIQQQANSRVNHNVITLHNGVTRNKLNLDMVGEGAECSCNGCVIADKKQHVDNNTLITHHVSHCTSNELYKYVLDEESTGAFAGRVLVKKDAQKTVSQMTNQNLTATKQARMYTQPMLEIYADDVKCAHGSTVGQLNDAALFYMQQRGISKKEARLLLQNAFINEVIDHMELEPLRDRLHYLVEKRFRGRKVNSSMYDINKVREDFPILSREVYGKPLVYLDNAATTQKPLCVLDAMREEYLNVNANVHRGVHYLSQQATDLHEAAREKVRQFINAEKTEEIVFTRGTTEAINLVASSFCELQMKEGDEVLVSEMEHHSNIVSWQLQAMKRGIVVKHLPITDKGELCLDSLESLISDKTKIISIAHVSNVLGTVNPVEEIIKTAHAHGIPVLVDGAQSAPHFKVDVQAMDCDFFAFSGHKMYGPTGIGVLYGKEEWLEKLPPYQGGGEMIDKVTWEKTTFERLPFKFEAGTPDYIATHGLATAIDYLNRVGLDSVKAHEAELTRYCMEQLRTIDGMRIFGEAEHKDAVVSFLVGDIHHLDMGTLLDRLGIAVRTGHHCAQPLMDRLGISGTVRASFALYNTKEEIDVLVNGIRRVSQMF